MTRSALMSAVALLSTLALPGSGRAQWGGATGPALGALISGEDAVALAWQGQLTYEIHAAPLRLFALGHGGVEIPEKRLKPGYSREIDANGGFYWIRDDTNQRVLPDSAYASERAQARGSLFIGLETELTVGLVSKRLWVAAGAWPDPRNGSLAWTNLWGVQLTGGTHVVLQNPLNGDFRLLLLIDVLRWR